MSDSLKDLVEHLRTVHFSMGILALVLIVAALEPPKAPLQRAYDDAMAIRLLHDHWRDWNQHLFENSTQLARGNENQFSLRITYVPDKPPENNRALSILQQASSRYLNSDVLLVTVGKRQEPTVLTPYHRRVFETLDEFISFWNETRPQVYQLTSVKEDSVTCDSAATSPVFGKGVVKAEHAIPLTSQREEGSAALGAESGDIWTLDSPDAVYSTGTLHFEPSPILLTKCSVTVRVRKIDIDARDIAANVAGRNAYWTRDPYATVFSDLASRTENFKQLPIATVANEMQTRLTADGERFEIFTAKIPAEEVTVIGPILLIVCQLYFTLHLRQLVLLVSKVNRYDVPSGYVCIYPGRINGVFAGLSISTPLLVTFAVLWKRVLSSEALATHFALTALACTTLLSILLIIWQLLLFRRVRSNLNPDGQANAPESLTDWS